MKNTVKIFSKEIQSEVPMTWVAESIEAIAKSLRVIEQTRATEKLIVALVHDHCGVKKSDVQTVIKALMNLDYVYLKPEVKK